MANKYSKLEPKVHPLTIVAIVAFFVVIVAFIFALQPTNSQRIYNAYQANANSYFTKDHPFVQTNYENGFLGLNRGLEKRIEKEEIIFVMISQPACTSCQAHIGTFQRYFESENMDEYVSRIYYLNASSDSKGLTKFAEAYEEVELSTPQFLVFKNGEIISKFTPVSGSDTQLINRSVRDFFRAVKTELNT